METVTVNANALRRVLQALIGPLHHITELQVTRGLDDHAGGNPIDVLIEDYNRAFAESQAAGSSREQP